MPFDHSFFDVLEMHLSPTPGVVPGCMKVHWKFCAEVKRGLAFGFFCFLFLNE